MAKHFVKLEDGHWAWLTDDEYKKHRRGGCLTTIIAILIFVGIAKKEGGESEDNNKSDFKTEQVSRKEKRQLKKDRITTTSAIKQETYKENSNAESEQTSTLDLNSESIGAEEEPEEIITIGESESNDADGIIN